MLRAEEHAAQEDGDRVVPRLDRGLGDATDRADDPGVVEHHVESTELGHCEIDRGRYVRFLSDVGRREPSPIAEFGDECSPGVDLHVGDDDHGTFGDEPSGSAGTDPARRPGDHGDLALQSTARQRPVMIRTRGRAERSGSVR